MLSLLFQRSSRDKLEISYDGFQSLLSHMNAFPEIYEIVKAFGERREGLGVQDDSWAGYYSRIQSSSNAPDGHPLWSTGTAHTGGQQDSSMAPGEPVMLDSGMTSIPSKDNPPRFKL